MNTHTLNPLNYSDLTYFHDSFRFMTFAQLEAERRCFEKALCGLSKPTDYRTSKVKVLETAMLVSESLGFAQSPNIEQLRTRLLKMQNEVIHCMLERLNQLSRAFHGASLIKGVDYEQTSVCVVSPIWHCRWSDLISGELRPAFVGNSLVDEY